MDFARKFAGLTCSGIQIYKGETIKIECNEKINTDYSVSHIVFSHNSKCSCRN